MKNNKIFKIFLTLIILMNIITSCPVFAASIIDTVTWKYKLDSNNVTVNDKNIVTAWGEFAPGNGEVIKCGDYLTFSKNSELENNSAHSGVQTGFAVLRLNGVEEEDTIFGDNLYLNSVNLSCKKLSATSKSLDVINENKWYVISFRVKMSSSGYTLDFRINNETIKSGAALDSAFLIEKIGGGNFDIKSLYIAPTALSDDKFTGISNYLTENNAYYTSKIDSVTYTVSNNEISATVNYDTPCKTASLFTVMYDDEGRMVKLFSQDISSGFSKNAGISILKNDNYKSMGLFIWDKALQIPICEKSMFLIRERDFSTPLSTEVKESLKTIPAFSSSVPESFKLNLEDYDNSYAKYLNAKGYLPKNFNESTGYIKKSDFVAILNNITGAKISAVDGNINITEAATFIYDSLYPLHKTYSKVLSGYEKEVSNLLQYGVITSEEADENIVLTQERGLKLLSDVAVAARLYEKGKGAEIPYTYIHSDLSDYKGELLVSSAAKGLNFAPDNIAYEAAKRECVNIKNTGDYLSFENLPESDKLILCFSIPKPDKTTPSYATLGLYINGVRKDTITLSSQSLYLTKSTYGGGGDKAYYRNYFEEATFDVDIKSGDSLMLKLDESDTLPNAVENEFSQDAKNSGISINYIKVEKAPEEKQIPKDYISAKEFGASGDDSYDDTNALQKAIDYVHNSGEGLYIPKGVYYTGKTLKIPSDVKISGAGMHYTVIDCRDTRGGRAGFSISGNDILVEDLKITASKSTSRNGSGGAFIGKGNRVLIKNVWMSKTNTGMWTELYNSKVESCRVTDTCADGIHFPHAAQNNIVSNCIITGCGDDGIATSSATTETGHSKGIAANNIVAENNTVERNYWGRGIMFSGNSRGEIKNNVISDIIQNPGILIWTEGSYNTTNTYNITVKDNAVTFCRRNSGLNRGAITVFNNRSSGDFWVDSDVYDNEIYQPHSASSIFVADHSTTKAEEAPLVYAEIYNNICYGTSIGSYMKTDVTKSVVVNKDNFIIQQ